MGYYEEAVERIKKMDTRQYIGISNKRYEEVRTRGEYKADSILIAEYYRRVGVFLQYLKKEATSIHAGMDLLMGFKMNENEWDNFTLKFPNFREINYTLMKLFSIHYLRWCSLLDDSNLIALQFPDVYEPMIKLFERGGGQINTHHHELVGGFGAFSRTIDARRGDMKPFDISDHALQLVIVEVEHAEAYLGEYKKGSQTEYTCLRCGNKLVIQSNITDYGYQWYKIKCDI